MIEIDEKIKKQASSYSLKKKKERKSDRTSRNWDDFTEYVQRMLRCQGIMSLVSKSVTG